MHLDAFVNSIDSFLQVLTQIRASTFTKVEQERQVALKSGELVKDVFQKWQQR
jgi:hypothetical protein